MEQDDYHIIYIYLLIIHTLLASLTLYGQKHMDTPPKNCPEMHRDKSVDREVDLLKAIILCTARAVAPVFSK